jgi:hypothetical protein
MHSKKTAVFRGVVHRKASLFSFVSIIWLPGDEAGRYVCAGVVPGRARTLFVANPINPLESGGQGRDRTTAARITTNKSASVHRFCAHKILGWR